MLYRLQQHGYSAYLVGGCIRDFLLNKTPKDFDIATDAHPEKLKKLFRNCILIGRRFRLAHIRFGRETIEVTTFRADDRKKSFKRRAVATHGMLLRDNIYGRIEEDAWRRDFTMNGLYYNIADRSLVDYCGGMADIQHKIVRIIGDPVTRYQEDPVRFLRAIRFAGKLGFTLAPKTGDCIPELAHLLHHVPPTRLFEEILKLFHHGQAFKTYQLLLHYQILPILFPQTMACFNEKSTQKLLEIACKNTDQRIRENKTVSPAFLFAVFLWPAVRAKLQADSKRRSAPLFILYQHAINDVLSEQQKQITIPRRYSTTMREIWDLQQRLSQGRAALVDRLLAHPRFRAAYDFLLLRAEAQEISPEIADWWSEFLSADDSKRKQLLIQLRGREQKASMHEQREKSL